MIYLTNLIEHPKNRFFLLLGASICFYLLRFSDAQLPFFWDELHAYVQGTIYMVDHKISMLPSAVPDNISFGHPLLLFFINAIWVKIFGISPLAFHSLSIVITLFTAFGCYILAIQITRNYIVGILSFVIFLFQPIVVAQSTQVLLEMLLTCTIVFALYFHIRGKFLYSVLCATLAVLTKETGLVLAIALPFALVIHYLFVERSSLFLKATLIHLIPFLVFAAFLVIQKQTYGWYLNPNNLNATKIEFNSITQRAWDYSLKFVWLKQGRWFLSVISLLYLVVLIANRKLKNGLNATMAVLLVFSFGFMIFSSIASCLHRYFLVMMPIVSVTFAITLYRINEYKKNLGLLLLIIGLGLNLYFLDDKTQNSEVNLSYRNQIKANISLFEYLNNAEFSNKKVKMDFPISLATKDPRFGYSVPINYDVVNFNEVKQVDYFVYTLPGNWSDKIIPQDSLILIHIIKVNAAKSLIFRKK
jgi:4-amino-4-deoxy-L-arabinose transferase-like glycosyltransferase